MVAKVAWGNEPAVAVGEAIEAMTRSRNLSRRRPADGGAVVLGSG